MNWNRTKRNTVAFSLALFVASVLPSAARAEDTAGEFTLSQPVHWGSAVLEPGDYKCTTESRGGAKVIFVRGLSGKPAYLFSAQLVAETAYSLESHLTLAVRGGERFVQALVLGGVGQTAYFSVPEEKGEAASFSLR